MCISVYQFISISVYQYIGIPLPVCDVYGVYEMYTYTHTNITVCVCTSTSTGTGSIHTRKKARPAGATAQGCPDSPVFP